MVPSDPNPPLDDPPDGEGDWPRGFASLPAPPADLADRLERATTRRVRARAWRRRGAVAFGVAAAYVAGALTPPWIPTGNSRPVPPTTSPSPTTTASITPRTGPTDAVAWSRELRERGDRLLDEAGDVAGALVCYREHLELASLSGRPAPDAGDSWLLSALKNEFR